MNPHGITHDTPTRVLVGPCTGHWRTFDAPTGELAAMAREMCGHCPLLDTCRRQRDEWLAVNATNPIDIAGTWAGDTFGGRSRHNHEKYTRSEAAKIASAAAAKRRTEKPPVTHCRNGHRFTDANTYVNPGTGRRQCKTCRNAAQQAFRARKAAA